MNTIILLFCIILIVAALLVAIQFIRQGLREEVCNAKAAKSEPSAEAPPVETDPVFLQAAAEVAALQPAVAPKGVSEEEIAVKVAAGLSRAQAIEVIERQIDWDKHPQSR